MRFLLVFILLAFPFVEIFVLVELAHRYGWWLLVYLVVIGYLGLQLIRGEKLTMSAKMMQSLSAGGNPVKTMLGTARNMIAGVLLMIPGVISDAIAVVLLVIPIKNSSPNFAGGNEKPHQQKSYNKAANDDVIEGEFTEIVEEKDQLK